MVPHSEPSAPGDLIRPYCDSCQPLDSIWHTVTLDCRDKDDKPTTMQKKVQIITNCSCSSCMESSRIKPDLNSLLQSLELESGHVGSQPHQFHLQQPHQQHQQIQHQHPQQQSEQQETDKESVSSDQPEHISEVPGFAYDTPDLLLNPNLNGSNKSFGSGKANERFLQLFKQLSEPGLGADKFDKLARLEGLEKLDKLQKLATEYAGAKELLAKLNELLHKYSQDEKTGIEPLQDEESKGPLTDDHQQLQPSSLSLSSSTSSSPPFSALAPELIPNIPELPKDDDDEDVPSLQEQQLRVAASMMHRTGPHHSMVLDTGVKEKIDVESHYLHPALAGQEISYHDNILLDKTKKKVF